MQDQRNIVQLTLVVQSDPNWMGQGRFKIMVHGVQASNYTITGSTDRSVVTLEEGEAYRGVVDKHDYEYYQFRADVPNADITFAITSFGGDPDLFVACRLEMTHDDNGWPSRL